MPKLKPMSTAPKNKCILLDIGLPWLVVGIWQEYYKNWQYASLCVSPCNDGDQVFNDIYFENEWDANPEGWLPMPQIERKK